MFDLIFKVVEVVVRNQDVIIGFIGKVAKTVSEVVSYAKETAETIMENEKAYTASNAESQEEQKQEGSSFAVWFQRIFKAVSCVKTMAPALKSVYQAAIQV